MLLNRVGVGLQAPRKLRFSHHTDSSGGTWLRGSPKPGGLSAGDGHHLKWGHTHYTKKTTERATEETGAKTLSSHRLRAWVFSPCPSPSSAALPPQVFTNAPPARMPQGPSGRPSWLLITSAHSVVVCGMGRAWRRGEQDRVNPVSDLCSEPLPQGPGVPTGEGHAAHSPAFLPPHPPRKSPRRWCPLRQWTPEVGV